jgi:hypothetical protein
MKKYATYVKKSKVDQLHAVKGAWGRGGTTPFFLNLGTRRG